MDQSSLATQTEPSELKNIKIITQYIFTVTRATNDPSIITIRDRAFSWLKVSTSAFTFKTLIRHYAIDNFVGFPISHLLYRV